MSRAPRLTGDNLIAALERASLVVARTRVGPGLLHKILRDCKVTVESLEALLRS